MLRWRGLAESAPDWERTVVTIGVFDGVHRGHRALIEAAAGAATEAGGLPVVVVTFDPHPDAVLHPDRAPTLLTTVDQRALLIERLGTVDALCTLPFTPELAAMPADEVVRKILVEHLRAATLVVGEGFRFGHRAAGDVDLLRDLGPAAGFSARTVPLVADEHGVVSSTRLRAEVAAGEVERAAVALGRPHRVEGLVVRGDQRGRELGFPTANLAPPATVVPADGVYAGWLVRGPARSVGEPETPLPAAISVGTNPTFAGDRARRVEAFILDFDEDIYGERVAVDFTARLRPTVAFDSVDALITQMNSDVDRVRALLHGG